MPGGTTTIRSRGLAVAYVRVAPTDPQQRIVREVCSRSRRSAGHPQFLRTEKGLFKSLFSTLAKRSTLHIATMIRISGIRLGTGWRRRGDLRFVTAQMAGLFGSMLAKICEGQVRKIRLDSSRNLDDAVLRDIGVSKTDLLLRRTARGGVT